VTTNPSNKFCEIEIHAGGLSKARNLLLSNRLKPQVLIFASAHLVTLLYGNTRLRKIAIKNGVFPDSWYLTRYMSVFDRKITQTRGPKFFADLLDDKSISMKHFLIASSEEELARLMQNALSRNPNLKVVGSLIPPYQSDHSSYLHEWISKIELANPDVVWIGIGTPNQLFLADELTRGIECKICCVGAAFSFYAGTQVEAPKFLRQIGFEWVFRLSKEPRRLFTRYAKGNTIFLYLLLNDLVKRKGIQFTFRKRKR